MKFLRNVLDSYKSRQSEKRKAEARRKRILMEVHYFCCSAGVPMPPQLRAELFGYGHLTRPSVRADLIRSDFNAVFRFMKSCGYDFATLRQDLGA